MALYLGSSGKLNVNINGVLYNFNFFSEAPMTNGTRLLSSESYILRDVNGLYLTSIDGDLLDIANLYAGVVPTTATVYLSDDSTQINSEVCSINRIGESDIRAILQDGHLIVEGKL